MELPTEVGFELPQQGEQSKNLSVFLSQLLRSEMCVGARKEVWGVESALGDSSALHTINQL